MMFQSVAETMTDFVVETTTGNVVETMTDFVVAATTEAHQKRPQTWRAGQSGNPAGRPKGSRNALTEDFLSVMYNDFKAHGMGAIVATREKDPATYVRVIASLLPKEVEFKRPLEGLSEDELMAAVATLQAMLAGATIAGEAVKTIELS